MKISYATSFQTQSYCAAYRNGVLVIVRLKDNNSAILDLAATNQFKRMLMDYELSDDERDPVDQACAFFARRLYKRKWIYAAYEGAIIHVHNAPVEQTT